MKHFSKHKLSLILGLLFSMSLLMGQTDKELSAINKLMAFRVSLTSVEPLEAVKKVDDFRKIILSESEKASISEEFQLVLDTLLVLEKYNYIYENNPKDPAAKAEIMPQMEKLDAYLEAHKEEKLNKWLYCLTGDTYSCCLQFMPMGDAMKYGLKIKDLYLIALEQDATMSYCLTNAGQWYYQAPAIGGGSKSKAKTYLQQALDNAKTQAEVYYASIFLSQVKYSQNDKDGCAELLDKASKIAPNSKMIQKMRDVNKIGEDYFYYVVHREEVEKKLSKS